MMKIVFISLLVLAMASAAGADLRIMVDGDKDPLDWEYIGSADYTLGIWTDTSITTGAGSYWALVVETSFGSIDPASGIVGVDDPGFFIERFFGIYEMLPGLFPGLNGLCGGAFDSVPPDTLAGTTLFDLIDFHTSWPLDVQIRLYESPDGAVLNLVDSVIVVGVPEPMTVGLFGLGVLFLRRRK